MAIQPIDLSTMYSQMDNVAKFNAAQTQGAQLSSQVKQDTAANIQNQKAQTVKEAAQDSESGKIREDGSNGGSQGLLSEKKKDKKDSAGEDSEESAEKKQWEITDPDLGQHIDILG